MDGGVCDVHNIINWNESRACIPFGIESVVIVASFVIRGIIVVFVVAVVMAAMVVIVTKALVCARAAIDILVEVLTIIGVRADMVTDLLTDVMIGGGVGMVTDVEIIVVAAALVAL